MIGFQLTCGKCDAPLTPNDEGSAPELDVINEDKGMWKLQLHDMGCPGIEAAWPQFDARPDDDMSWHDAWDELCESHYATWRLSVHEVVETPQERTQSVSGDVSGSDGTPMFEVVGTMTARLDNSDVVELEDVDVLPDHEDDHERDQRGSGGVCRNCSRLIAQCVEPACGIRYVHTSSGSHYCDDPPVHGFVIVNGEQRVRFAELDPAT